DGLAEAAAPGLVGLVGAHECARRKRGCKGVNDNRVGAALGGAANSELRSISELCRWLRARVPCGRAGARGHCRHAEEHVKKRTPNDDGRFFRARAVSARSFARTGAAGRIAGPGVGAGAADAAGIRLGAPGADLTVRAVGHAAVGGVDLPAATAVGQAVALAGRARLLCIGGGSDPGLHRRGRYLSAGWAAVPRGGSESLPAPCADRPDHVGPAAALLLPAEPVATAGAGRVAGPHRVVAGTASLVFPVDLPETHGESGGHR